MSSHFYNHIHQAHGNPRRWFDEDENPSYSSSSDDENPDSSDDENLRSGENPSLWIPEDIFNSPYAPNPILKLRDCEKKARDGSISYNFEGVSYSWQCNKEFQLIINISGDPLRNKYYIHMHLFRHKVENGYDRGLLRNVAYQSEIKKNLNNQYQYYSTQNVINFLTELNHWLITKYPYHPKTQNWLFNEISYKVHELFNRYK